MGLFRKLNKASDMFKKATETGKGLFNKASEAVSQGTEFVSDIGSKVEGVTNTVEKNLDKVNRINEKYIGPALQTASIAGVPFASQLLGASEGLSNLAGRVKDVNSTVQKTNNQVQNVNNKISKGNQVANRVARKI